MSPYEYHKFSLFGVDLYNDSDYSPDGILDWQAQSLHCHFRFQHASSLDPFSLSLEKSIQVLSLHIFFCPLNFPCLLLRSYHSMLLPFPRSYLFMLTLLFLAPRNSFFLAEPISPMFYSSLFPFTQNTNVQSPNDCKMQEKKFTKPITCVVQQLITFL